MLLLYQNRKLLSAYFFSYTTLSFRPGIAVIYQVASVLLFFNSAKNVSVTA